MQCPLCSSVRWGQRLDSPIEAVNTCQLLCLLLHPPERPLHCLSFWNMQRKLPEWTSLGKSDTAFHQFLRSHSEHACGQRLTRRSLLSLSVCVEDMLRPSVPPWNILLTTVTIVLSCWYIIVSDCWVCCSVHSWEAELQQVKNSVVQFMVLKIQGFYTCGRTVS